MKKKLIILILSIIHFNIYGQALSDKVKYKAPGIYLTTQDKNGKETNRLPFGKNVHIYVDTFYKSYIVTYEVEEGGMVWMDLKYVKETSKKTYLMFRDGNYYYINDDLDRGRFYIIMPQSTKNETVMLRALKVEKDE